MTEYTSLEKIRLQKLEELRAEGIEVYPSRAKRTHLSTEAIAEFESKEKDGVEVKARLAGLFAQHVTHATQREATLRTGERGLRG